MTGTIKKKAFGVAKIGRAKRSAQRSADKAEARQVAPRVQRANSAPVLVVIVGPKNSGKSTLLKSVVKSYTRHNLNGWQATIVVGKEKRLTVVECPDDLSAMIDLSKIADVVLFTVDASFGLEASTFEMISLLQTHGMPKVAAVMTHLDRLKANKSFSKTKKNLKHRIWDELYQGAKVFEMSGVLKSGKYYPRNETKRLGLFLERQKLRPLRWRSEHSYVLCDRADRRGATLECYGWIRGPGRLGAVHVPGVGDFQAPRIDYLEDPLPSFEELRVRGETLKRKRAQTLLYAPMETTTETTAEEEEEEEEEEVTPSLFVGEKKKKKSPPQDVELFPGWENPLDIEEQAEEPPRSSIAAAAAADDNLGGGGGGGGGGVYEEEDEDDFFFSRKAPPDEEDDDVISSFDLDDGVLAAARFRCVERYGGGDALNSSEAAAADDDDEVSRCAEEVDERAANAARKEEASKKKEKEEEEEEGGLATKRILEARLQREASEVTTDAGKYVRISLPVSSLRYDDAKKKPLLICGVLDHEKSRTMACARIRRHRWHPKVLKSRDPVFISCGWRRFETAPIYSIEDRSEKRNRFLKYSPEHMHCLSTFFAPGPVAPNTPLIGFGRRGAFRACMVGVATRMASTSTVVKKLKLQGTPLKIERNTAFVGGTFGSQLEAAKFEGATVKTVSGVRGSIKKALREPPGAFRATFEDKILPSDIVVCRVWVPVAPPAYCAEHEMTARTTSEVRREEQIPVGVDPDSVYKGPVERLPRKFAPHLVPKTLVSQLPRSPRSGTSAPLCGKKPKRNARNCTRLE
ncbi:hypothetical protein CTAYLR_004189 [Chrysophaeum taylorii]|uniref:Bms1-type G domain-containing protein n=1 Tax=Chrysophaeum taylorii TaxID=2483200 RepID=A0AAD7XNM0_9STRA|nr:hypothetical protein CTAYLR_004189 [Chrysophaeum taylorii]